jgi:hypothetical protein
MMNRNTLAVATFAAMNVGCMTGGPTKVWMTRDEVSARDAEKDASRAKGAEFLHAREYKRNSRRELVNWLAAEFPNASRWQRRKMRKQILSGA